MINELESAVTFLSDLLSKKVPAKEATIFRQTLLTVLVNHYEDHWFPSKPYKGSAYRCIRINKNQMDPLIAKAGQICGISDTRLLQYLPSELTMWVDPREVSYRIGEEGSIGVIYASDTDPESSSPSPEPPKVASASPKRVASPQSHPPSPALVSQSPLASASPQSSRGSSPVGQLGYNSYSPSLQRRHFQQQLQQQMQFQANYDFLRSCKEQLRYILPESSDAMNWECLATTFVAS